MVGCSGALAFVLGLFFGIVVTVTKKGGVMQHITVYQTIDKIVNFFRSIPFIILLAGLIPLTRWIMGSAIGVKGAIVPLVFGTTPFFTRQIEAALAEVDRGIVEAAQSMGSGPVEIVFRVYLKESLRESPGARPSRRSTSSASAPWRGPWGRAGSETSPYATGTSATNWTSLT
jgi:D-methionine transport system permease protein